MNAYKQGMKGENKMKKLRTMFFAVAATCGMLLLTPMASATTQDMSVGLEVPTHTKEEIIQFLKEHPTYKGSNGNSRVPTSVYVKEPSYDKGFEPGELHTDYLQDGLNAVNNVRYIAGLPANVTLNKQYTKAAQAGILINGVQRALNHTPTKPQGMSESLYQLGYKGTSSSNLAAGFSSLSDAVITGWMYDGDTSNIKDVGHRRWILNPPLKQTGFGSIETFHSMYVMDNVGASFDEAYDVVAWPAQVMPTLYFSDNDPWSLSFDNSFSETAAMVTMTRQSDGRTWKMGGYEDSESGRIYTSARRVGQPLCIIWRPNKIQYRPGDVFTIEIEGVTKNGKDYPIRYQVKFFDLDNPELNQAVDDVIFTVGQSDYIKNTVQYRMHDPVIIHNDRLMFPITGLRLIVEGKYQWNWESKTFYIDANGKEMFLRQDEVEGFIRTRETNGRKVEINLNTPPIVKDDTVYLPLADFCDFMEISYEWDPITQTVKFKSLT